MSYKQADIIKGLREQTAAATAEATELQALDLQLKADVSKVEKEIDQAWVQLSETLIPGFDPEVLKSAATVLHLPSISAGPVQRRLDEYIQTAQNAVQTLNADPMVIDRINLINTAQINMAELDEALGSLVDSVKKLEAEPYFQELLTCRYGQAEYAVKFFQLLYYTHWKNADLIVAKFGPDLKVSNFAELAARYKEEHTALLELQATRKRFEVTIETANHRARQAAQAEQDIAQAVPRALAVVRARVREHLGPLADSKVAELLAAFPELDLAWRRIAGLRKKEEYLRALAKEHVEGALAELSALRQKIDADASKVMRPKNASRVWADADWNLRLSNDRRPRWLKRRERTLAIRRHLMGFDRYDRWHPGSDLLWWDLMSDGQLDGNFIQEVRSRPHHHVHHQHRDDNDVNNSFADVS